MSSCGSDVNYLRNLSSAQNPKIGDYWSERLFVPVAIVVDVTDTTVLVCEKIKQLTLNSWICDLSNLIRYTRADFIQRFRYGRIDNPDFIATDDENNIKNKFWADVETEEYPWIRDELDGKSAIVDSRKESNAAEMDDTSIRIVCAANRFPGLGNGPIVICGARHFDTTMHAVIEALSLQDQAGDAEQGFIDQKGTFLTREEALVVATKAGQLNVHRPKTQPANKLFSEDLY